MNDTRFATEYKKSVDAVALPEGYKESLISALIESEKTRSSETGGKNTWNIRSFIPAIIAASLVILLGFGAFFAMRGVFLEKEELHIKVYSATNLSCIKGARIVFRDKDGNPLADRKGDPLTAITDESGTATATLPRGKAVSAEISSEGYIPLTTEAGSTNVYISPIMTEDTYRAVLTWKDKSDLDAILTREYKGINEQLYYFNSDFTNEEGTVIATLDTDSENGSGPETVTFNAVGNGYFRFSVGSYSSLKEDGEISLSDAGATVTLYQGDKLIGEYIVSDAESGNVWCVFEVSDGTLTIIDDLYTVSAMTEIK